MKRHLILFISCLIGSPFLSGAEPRGLLMLKPGMSNTNSNAPLIWCMNENQGSKSITFQFPFSVGGLPACEVFWKEGDTASIRIDDKYISLSSMKKETNGLVSTEWFQGEEEFLKAPKIFEKRKIDVRIDSVETSTCNGEPECEGVGLEATITVTKVNRTHSIGVKGHAGG